METFPDPPPGRGNQPEPSWEEAHETMERERAKQRCEKVQAKLETAIRKVEDCALSALDQGKQRIRQYPVEAVSVAAVTGFFWHRLPVAAMLGTGVRFLVGFAPPVLAALGACVVVEKLRHHDDVWRNSRGPLASSPPPPTPPFPPPPATDGL